MISPNNKNRFLPNRLVKRKLNKPHHFPQPISNKNIDQSLYKSIDTKEFQKQIQQSLDKLLVNTTQESIKRALTALKTSPQKALQIIEPFSKFNEKNRKISKTQKLQILQGYLQILTKQPKAKSYHTSNKIRTTIARILELNPQSKIPNTNPFLQQTYVEARLQNAFMQITAAIKKRIENQEFKSKYAIADAYTDEAHRQLSKFKNPPKNGVYYIQTFFNGKTFDKNSAPSTKFDSYAPAPLGLIDELDKHRTKTDKTPEKTQQLLLNGKKNLKTKIQPRINQVIQSVFNNRRTPEQAANQILQKVSQLKSKIHPGKYQIPVIVNNQKITLKIYLDPSICYVNNLYDLQRLFRSEQVEHQMQTEHKRAEKAIYQKLTKMILDGEIETFGQLTRTLRQQIAHKDKQSSKYNTDFFPSSAHKKLLPKLKQFFAKRITKRMAHNIQVTITSIENQYGSLITSRHRFKKDRRLGHTLWEFKQTLDEKTDIIAFNNAIKQNAEWQRAISLELTYHRPLDQSQKLRIQQKNWNPYEYKINGSPKSPNPEKLFPLSQSIAVKPANSSRWQHYKKVNKTFRHTKTNQSLTLKPGDQVIPSRRTHEEKVLIRYYKLNQTIKPHQLIATRAEFGEYTPPELIDNFRNQLPKSLQKLSFQKLANRYPLLHAMNLKGGDILAYDQQRDTFFQLRRDPNKERDVIYRVAPPKSTPLAAYNPKQSSTKA